MSESVALPGEIPGLLIPGVLVIYHCMTCRVLAVPHINMHINMHMVRLDTDFALIKDIALDLSDRVSRIAAAWWVIERGPVTEEEHIVLLVVKNGGHLNQNGQEQLRDMVLRRYNRSQT